MKIACFSESPADQAALAVFVAGILGETVEAVPGIDLQAHGISGVFSALDGVIRGLHYNSDADGMVVVVDSDTSVLHEPSHDEPGGAAEDCQYCRLSKIAEKARNQLKPRRGRPVLKVAIGLAVPAIEAWYLVGRNHQVGEAAWKADPPFTTAKLKVEVYGTDRPSIETETARAVEEARRIIANISEIENAFPVGFGAMANKIRAWKKPTTQA